VEIELRLDPPAPPFPKQRERTILAEALRELPGEFILLGKLGTGGSARTMAWQIRHGHPNLPEFAPAGSYEAEARTLLDGEHRVYVKYVGKQGSE
jgi:hypothetical protein